MSIKLVLDSSADVTSMAEIPFAYAPLKVCTAEREFIDDDGLDVVEMVEFLASYKGRSSSSCPNAEDWLTAFGDAEEILCITITGGLSGSYNTACTAKEIYEETHPGRRVEVLDSRTAGPEITLIAHKARDLIREGKDMTEVITQLSGYKTEILFCLESLHNFANNGRVSKTVAAAAGLLGIRAVGRASDEGTLEMLTKARGEAKAMEAIKTYLAEYGYRGGRLYIHHCFADEVVERLAVSIRRDYPTVETVIRPTRGLCSFYAERGGFLVAFEVG